MEIGGGKNLPCIQNMTAFYLIEKKLLVII